MSVSEAAVDIDLCCLPEAHGHITDVEAHREAVDPPLRLAREEYDYRNSRQHLMRLLDTDCSAPCPAETAQPVDEVKELWPGSPEVFHALFSRLQQYTQHLKL